MADEATELEGSAPTGAAAATDTPPANATASGTATETPAEGTSADDDRWAWLDGVDPDELIRKLPKLQGKVGARAQQQAEKIATERIDKLQADQRATQQQAAETAEREERQRLARENPDALAEKILADEAAREERALEQQRFVEQQNQMAQHIETELNAVYSRPAVKALMDSGDEATRNRLNWRNYRTFAEFVEGVGEALTDHRANAKAEELAKARLEAMQRDGQAGRFRTEGAGGADLGLSGGVPGGRLFTREEIADMPLDEYRKHKGAIAQQAAAGLI